MLLTASRSVGMTSQVELLPSLAAVPRGLHRASTHVRSDALRQGAEVFCPHSGNPDISREMRARQPPVVFPSVHSSEVKHCSLHHIVARNRASTIVWRSRTCRAA